VAWARRTFERARELAIRVLDVVPGARRLIGDLIRIELIDRCMIIAAQALLALTPLLIVLAAFLPHDYGESLVHQLQELMGLDQAHAELLEQTQAAARVQTQTGLLGVVVVLASALSFGRAIQRLHERVWGMAHRGGLAGRRLCLGWLVGWLASMELAAMLGEVLKDEAAWDVVRLAVRVVLGTAVWWWTAHVLLRGEVPWRSLWCGALLTGAGTTILVQGSLVVMPRYAASNIAQFGAFGLFFSLASWLIAFAAVMVVANVTGRVVTEELLGHRRRPVAGTGSPAPGDAPGPSRA
jgi:membrane protein